MSELETRTPEQLPLATAVSPAALTVVQEPGGPLRAVPISALLGRLISTDCAKETRVALFADLTLGANSVGLVFADPDPALNGWYRKTGAAGAGAWVQFEKLQSFAASEAGGHVAQAQAARTGAESARDGAVAFSNFVVGGLAAGEAATAVGVRFSVEHPAGVISLRIREPVGSTELAAMPASAALLAAAGAGMVGLSHSAAYPPGSVGARMSRVIHVTDAPMLAVVDNDSNNDQTAKVQQALNLLDPDLGGLVFVDFGVKFRTRGLTFPMRGNMIFRLDDNLTQGDLIAGEGRATNELVHLVFNANPGGVVNEQIDEANFSFGRIVNLADDVTGHDGWLAADQSKSNPEVPARIHAIWDRRRRSFWRQIFEHFHHHENNSGIYQHLFRNAHTLNGVGLSGWPAGQLPAVLETVQGVTSTARGVIRAVTDETLTVQYLYGLFLPGEKLRKVTVTGPPGAKSYVLGAESDNAISSLSFSHDLLPAFGADLWTGRWRLGAGNFGLADETFEVDGSIKSCAAPNQRGLVQQTDYVGFQAGDSPERKSISDHNILELAMDLQVAPAARRWVARRKIGAGAWNRQGVAAVHQVECNFSHHASAPVPVGRTENVASIETLSGSGAGIYRVNFTNALTDALYQARADLNGDGADNWHVQVTTSAVGSCIIRLWDAAGTAADIPASVRINLVVTGGMIA